MKITTESEGRPWSIETSSARNHKPFVAVQRQLSSSASYPRMSSEKSSSNYGYSGGYQDTPTLSRYGNGPDKAKNKNMCGSGYTMKKLG